MGSSSSARKKFVVHIGRRNYTIELHGSRYRWDVRDGHGGRLRRSFSSPDEAERELRAEIARVERLRSDGRVRREGVYTLGEIVDMWYERHHCKLDEGGQLDYEGRIRRDVSRIAHWNPERVRRADIDDFYATLMAHTAHRLHPILNQAFEHAIENEWVAVTQNPFRRIKPKRPPSEEIDVPFPREVEKMLVSTLDHAWYIFLLITSVLGTRRSETVALMWSDIEFERRQVHIRRAYAKKTKRYKLTKTHETRTLRFDPSPATDEFFEDLYVYRLQHPDGDYLFPPRRRDSRSPVWHPDSVSHGFARYTASIGLPYTHPHCLRHFVATHLLESGATTVQVAKWLGHKDDTQVRRRYANHIREDSQRGMGATAAALVLGHDAVRVDPSEAPSRGDDAAI